MSDTPDTSGTPGTPDDAAIDRERVLAAEFSLGLLEGEELLAARGRMARDPVFAARRQWWDDWFVPLSDDVAPVEPGADMWERIAAQVQVGSANPASEAGANVAMLDLERRVRRWQWTAALTSAAAALALALFLVAPSGAPREAPSGAMPATEAPLIASLPIGDTPLRLNVTYLPGGDELLVSAAGLTADGVHDHELWIVPEDGSPLQSLGVVIPGEARRVALPQEIARNFGDGVRLVLTREPIGGKPEGGEAGPVVANAALGKV